MITRSTPALTRKTSWRAVGTASLAVAVVALMGVATPAASATAATSASAAPTSAAAIQQDVFLSGDGTAMRFDADTQQWSSLALPAATSGVVASPDGETAYFSSWDAQAIYVVDAASGALTRTIPLAGNAPWNRGPSLALDRDGSTLFVAGYNGMFSRIDTASGTVTGTLRLSAEELSSVAISPDGRTAFVLGYYDAVLHVVDLGDLSLVTTIPLDTDPVALTLSPDGRRLYIGHHLESRAGRNVLTVVDTTTLTIVDALTNTEYGDAFGPNSLAISADGTTLHGIDQSGEYAVFDPQTLTATVQYVAPPGSLTGISTIALTADASTAVAAYYQPGVQTIDVATREASAALPIGNAYTGIAVVPDQAPVAAFVSSESVLGDATTFDASASTASQCDIATYDWDFGDGTTATSTDPGIEHVYEAAGSFTVTLTLTTSCGTSTTGTSYTGQQLLRNADPSATTAALVSVLPAASATELTIDPIADQTTRLDDPAEAVDAVAHSSAGLAISYSATGLPDGITIHPVTGRMSGTPGSVGTSRVTVTASTADGASVSTAFTWNVVGSPVNPENPDETENPGGTEHQDRVVAPDQVGTPGPVLASTGAEFVAGGVVAAVLLVAGLVVMVIARRSTSRR